jgi:hypothetical protein
VICAEMCRPLPFIGSRRAVWLTSIAATANKALNCKLDSFLTFLIWPALFSAKPGAPKIFITSKQLNCKLVSFRIFARRRFARLPAYEQADTRPPMLC